MAHTGQCAQVVFQVAASTLSRSTAMRGACGNRAAAVGAGRFQPAVQANCAGGAPAFSAPQAVYVVPLHDENHADVSCVDANTASLGELFHAGFPSPLKQAVGIGTKKHNLNPVDNELASAGRGVFAHEVGWHGWSDEQDFHQKGGDGAVI